MQLRRTPHYALASFLAMVAVVACGSAASEDMASGAGTNNYPYPGTGGGSGAAGAATGGSPGYDAGADALPPEQELESTYESPVATGRYVWVTNPVSGRVAYVDATTLEVRTVPAGNGPRYMAAIPGTGTDAAVVLNTLSNDATILRANTSGAMSTKTLKISAGANAWALSHDGTWAIAWTNARTMQSPDPVQGFQDVTVLRLTPGEEKATRLSVGYRPVALQFSADDKTAYAVTQDGVSVMDLAGEGGPVSARVVPMTDDPMENPDTRDVSITADGAYAFVRRDGSKEVTFISLADGALGTVVLPAACTDFDLSPDGTKAIAVVRDTHQIAILRVPEIVTDPTAFQLVSVPKATVGSVAIAPAAPIALGYTNAIAEQLITKIAFDETPVLVKPLKLHGAVSAVFPSYTGASAIVVHRSEQGPSQAFSALSLAPELPARIQGTLAPITAVALTPSGDRAVVAERDDVARIFGAYLVRSSNQQIDRYVLASPPIAVGTVVEAKRAYIAQEHTEGRLTFIDLDTGLARTLTGFELGARVIDGSTP